MNLKKVMLAAVAVAMGATTVFAQEAAAEESCSRAPRSYGWSVIAVGLATPVQIPWGLNKWDIFGLDLNLGYSDAPKMYGWEFALGANTARQRMVGLQTALGFNYTAEDAYGMAVSLYNMNRCKAYGLSVDAVGFNNNFYGLEANLVGAFTKKNFGGLQVSGLTSIVGDNLYGAQLAVGANFAKYVYGLQAAIVYNQTDKLCGCQIALVNMAFECEHGFQIGLVNVIMDNQLPFLPFVNAYF
jgi:hypothetical protein